jgi:hypothetical protein
MEVPAYLLKSYIKDSIRWLANRKPSLIVVHGNCVGIYWKILEEQDSIYDMFNKKDDMEFYYEMQKQIFQQEYPNLILDVKYSYGPVEYEGKMYSRIIYYYYPKFYQYTNVFLDV